MVRDKKINKNCIKEICRPFILSNEQLKEVWVRMYLSIKQGLRKETNAMSDVKCPITYVHNLPTGNERGKYLALDLCGPKFRILLFNIKSEDEMEIKLKHFETPYKILIGPGVDLFNFIIECLIEFTKENYVSDERLPLGLTFPFPIEQHDLTKAILKMWDKGFRCSGVVGEDVFRLLQTAIDRRRELKVIFYGIIQDTTGTLTSGAFKYSDCKISCIVGNTVNNACYFENIEKCEYYNVKKNTNYKTVIVSTEWGNFGLNKELDFIKTKEDKEIDMTSNNPGYGTFEKMISGTNMGEIVRLLLVKCTKSGYLFNGRGSNLLFTKGSFLTRYIFLIEKSSCIDNVCFKILADLDICHATDDDCKNLRYICEVVSSRSAHLTAAGLTAILNKLSEPIVTVAVAGTVCTLHPRYLYLLASKIRQLIYHGLLFKLAIAVDRAGKGTALMAAAEHKNKLN